MWASFLHWLIGRKVRVPKHLNIQEMHYFLDGGTTVFIGSGPWWWRWSITLTQHLFDENESWGPPGRLFLGGYLVPMRSEVEREIISLLRRCVAEIREQPRPEHSAPTSEVWAEPQQDGGAILFGSPELAHLYGMSFDERKIRHLERVIAYVESDKYGMVTETE